MDQPFYLIEPKRAITPIVLSVPHCGTEFPDELAAQYRAELRAQPDDTDWHVHQLYDFVSELGIAILHARYSRWVIDLNRDPASQPLYSDGRIITGLTPNTDFFGNEVYVDQKFIPTAEETERRLTRYYRPYHQRLENLLANRRETFGRALLWDAHSIRRCVPTIQPEPFPDLILGDNDGKSASPEISALTLGTLRASKFQVNHNSPFKGGQITRHFGRPNQGFHALQLEMAKPLYLQNDEHTFDLPRADRIRAVLRNVFTALLNHFAR
jgi:N-formylglutamate deformylase